MEKTQNKKKYTITRKPMHKKVIDLLAENSGTLGSVMKRAGYSKSVQQTPTKVTNTQSFQALMIECGLTEEFIASALVEDIRSKPQNRVKELELGAKIKRMTSSDVQSGVNILNIISFNSSTEPLNDDTSQNV